MVAADRGPRVEGLSMEGLFWPQRRIV
jgi:hypothetical protein